MKVILTEAVTGLGRPGEAVDVAPGYARNYLLPKGLAEQATPAKVKEWESRRGKIEKKLAEERAAAAELAGKLAEKTVSISARAGEEGKLFGSVTSKDIADAVAQQTGLEIDRKKLDLREPLKALGSHRVNIALHPDVVAVVTVEVVAEAGAPEAQ